MTKAIKTFALVLASAVLLTACQSGGGASRAEKAADATVGTVNPYLWRASLDTLQTLPVASADPLGGIINYDWKSFEGAPNERVKATVYILDTRLRADGVKVAVFRQTNTGGTWTDAAVDPDTAAQLEGKILERARSLKASELS
jgi:PBP1b-binding outer membrane lipoprotein LpoB